MKFLKDIKPIDNLSLVDKAEIEILSFLKENNLQPGDPIPKELDFAKSFDVSRTVVREALLRLRTLGLIDSKKHRGMVLKQPDIVNNFERILDPSLLSMEVLKQLFELRLILEMGMSDFLFRYKTDKDIKELEEIVANEEKVEQEKNVFALDKEVAFHGKLYQMSRNTTLKRFQNLLLPVFEYVYTHELNKEDNNYNTETKVTHRDLLNNLRVGTPETFRSAMRQHLEPHFRHIFTEEE